MKVHKADTNPAALPSRRAVLKGAAAISGALILGANVSFPTRLLGEEPPAAGVITPNVFLKIDSDNAITILSKHFEMGQGVVTGLATLVAEELEADWSDIRFAFAPNDPALYNNLFFGSVMGTGGSTSMANSWVQMRKVGAAARMMLVAAAAAKWDLPVDQIKAEKGVLSHDGDGRRATFGELAGAAMALPVPTSIPLKAPADWKLIGTRVPRLDSESKTKGTAIFAFDIRRPDMLTAVIKRPDRFGATLGSFDDRAARAVDGVEEIVQVPSGIAVLARDTWSAIRGRDALKASWNTANAEMRSTDEIWEEYRKLAATEGLSAIRRGDAEQGLERAEQVVESEFTFPYLAHTPMEPLNCVMQLGKDGAEIWSGCQLQSVDMAVAAEVLGLKPEQIIIHTCFGGGSFGRRGNPVGKWIAELASIAKATDGRWPVHLVWTREDDVKGGFYRPMVLHRVRAGIDLQGKITGWEHVIVSQSLFTGTPFQQMLVSRDGIDRSTVEGTVNTRYDIDDFSVSVHNAKSPVPVLWWRSVGHSHGAHVMETTIDELAILAGKDPVAFRANLLKAHPRDGAVLRLAAEKSGWDTPLPAGRGRGIACHRSFDTRIAMVAEVRVSRENIKVDRIVAAVDCGVAINPDVIAAQIEGAVGFALSAAFRNRITLQEGMVEQSNFDNYEPTRMREMPIVEVHIVPSKDAPTGIGEPGVPPVAPAIGNAIFAATGKRLRSLPFDLESAI